MKTDLFTLHEDLYYKNWRKLPMCPFDFEATAVNPQEARAVQVCAMIFHNGKLKDEFTTLINPGVPIPESSSEIHGIYDEDVKDAPTFKEIAPKLIDFMVKAELLVAFNGLSYDYPLLQAEQHRCESPLITMPMLDPLVWEREERKKMRGRNTQDEVARRCGVASAQEIIGNKAMSSLVEGDTDLRYHEARTDVITLQGIVDERAEIMPYNMLSLIERQQEIFDAQQEYYRKRKERREARKKK